MTSKHPRLRSHVRRRADGRVRVYYFYDMRHEGQPDVPLGTDYDDALRRWDELHNRRPQIAGTLQEAFDRFRRDVIPTMSAGNAKNYTAHIKALEPAMGRATWDAIARPDLRAYYDRRTRKGLAVKELKALSYIWNCALDWGLTRLPNPAAGMRLKGGYGARQFEVRDELFAAVYQHADQVLRDCLDLMTATGMRPGDVLRATLMDARGDVLALQAGKTGKRAEFDLTQSAVLPAMIERRRALRAEHLMLLSTPSGHVVSAGMLRARWESAREAAALAAEQAGQAELATQLRAMYLRDMRKRAADLAGDITQASRLLQHSSERVTRLHYRTRAERVTPVR